MIHQRLAVFASLGEIYHYTNMADAVKILKQGRFRLSTNLGTKSDQGTANYFLSMTRSKLGHFHAGSTHGVMLVLDPDYLTPFGKLGPVDYWGREFRKVDPKHNEMEERLWSRKQFLPLPKPAAKLITAIHVLRQLPDAWGDEFNFQIRELWLLAKLNRIKLYFYNNPKDWQFQRKDRAIPLQQALPQLTGQKRMTGRRLTDWTKEWRELAQAPSRDKLSDRAKRMIHGIGYHPEETTQQLMADLHNQRGDERIGKLVSLIQRHGGVKQFIQYLADKYEEK